MSNFQKPFSENMHPRPTITPFAKKVWLAASLRMYEHFKELGVEQYAMCYLQQPKRMAGKAFASTVNYNSYDEEE